MEVSQKFKLEVPTQPAIPLLGSISYHAHTYCLITPKKIEPVLMSPNRQTDNGDKASTHNGTLIGCEEKWDYETWRKVDASVKYHLKQVTQTKKEKKDRSHALSRVDLGVWCSYMYMRRHELLVQTLKLESKWLKGEKEVVLREWRWEREQQNSCHRQKGGYRSGRVKGARNRGEKRGRRESAEPNRGSR